MPQSSVSIMLPMPLFNANPPNLIAGTAARLRCSFNPSKMPQSSVSIMLPIPLFNANPPNLIAGTVAHLRCSFNPSKMPRSSVSIMLPIPLFNANPPNLIAGTVARSVRSPTHLHNLCHQSSIASTTKEVDKELLPLVRVYKDGSVERLEGSPHVSPSPDQDPETGVSSKDVTISQNPTVSARLYLPKLTTHHQKLPILVYFHGGGFCVESAFSCFSQRYLNRLVSQSQVVAVSVEYRLAPEHLLPAAYEDCWTALQWVASHHKIGDEDSTDKEPWLSNHGDFRRVFIAGDSAGGNIAHNIAMRAGVESLNGGVKIFGAVLSHPAFWGSEPIGSESRDDHEKKYSNLVWEFVYPSAPGGMDDAMINPVGPGKPSLAKLGCSKLLVCVAEKDYELRERGVWYYNAVKESGFGGEVELFESEGGGHAFHIYDPETENAKCLIKRLASFVN